MPDTYTPDDERFLRKAKIDSGRDVVVDEYIRQIASLEHQQCLLRAALDQARESRSRWRFWCLGLAVALAVMTFWRQ